MVRSVSLLLALLMAAPLVPGWSGPASGEDVLVHPALLARAPDEVGWAVVAFEAPPGEARQGSLRERFQVVHPWTLIPAVGVIGKASDILALAHEPGVVQLDATSYDLALRESTGQIGAPEVWDTLGYDGTGVTVAVLDTGIDDKHPDLDLGKVVRRVSFETSWAGVDGTHDIPGMALQDAFGHGTHVASTVAGTGEVPGPLFGDSYKGVAPGASLVSVQISTTGGVIFNGTSLGVGVITTWAALDAVEWVIANRDALDMRVASNSWGIPMATAGFQVCTDDPVARAIRAGLLLEPTLIWVFAAGNEGSASANPGTIRSPACLPEVITVGAVDRNDVQANFSSEGPTRGDAYPKPDVAAPGVGIVAAQTLHPSVYTALNALDHLGGTGPRDPVQRPFYTSSSGTSMAAPHVAGLVALMVQAAPCLTQAQAGAILNGTALDRGAAGFDMRYGHGRVRAPQAVAAADALC